MKVFSKNKVSQLEDFRMRKDEFFAEDPHSPLTEEQQRTFEGLQYFPENPDLRLEVPLEEFEEKDSITVQTSTGDVQEYIRIGQIHFDVDGQRAGLVVYQNEHGFFMPFVDSLANKETYGAGRYLEPHPLSNGKLLVDFNMAYNPYCAYNEHYSCPLTPFENRLKVPVQAGEKLPEGDWVIHSI